MAKMSMMTKETNMSTTKTVMATAVTFITHDNVRTPFQADNDDDNEDKYGSED